MTTAITPIDEIKGSIRRMEPEFKAALPKQVGTEKFMRVLITAIAQTPDLLTADRTSLYAACMKSAQDGLLPDNREAALVPFSGKVQYMVMVGGILKKIRNSGELSMITSQIVHKNDTFDYGVNDIKGEYMEHKPMMFGDRGPAIGVYALAKTKDGAVYIEVMTKEQVMAVKASSRAKSGPWTGAFETEMWRKTAIRRLSKRLPMSTDLEQVITRDDEDFEPEAAQPSESNTSRLEKIVAAKTPAKPEATEADLVQPQADGELPL